MPKLLDEFKNALRFHRIVMKTVSWFFEAVYLSLTRYLAE